MNGCLGMQQILSNTVLNGRIKPHSGYFIPILNHVEDFLAWIGCL